MIEILEMIDRTAEKLEALTRVWEASARATHRFLTEEEIVRIRGYVPQAMAAVEHLVTAISGWRGKGGLFPVKRLIFSKKPGTQPAVDRIPGKDGGPATGKTGMLGTEKEGCGMEIPQRIQESRKKKGISQEQLAEVLGVSRQAVSKWESGQAMPELDKVIGMSEYFGVSTDWLLRGVEPAGDPPAGRGKPGREWIARAALAFGALGSGALWLASRFVKVPIPYHYTENGQELVMRSGDRTGHSLRYFVEHYDLEGLAVVLALAAIAGAAGLVLWTRKQRKKQ